MGFFDITLQKETSLNQTQLMQLQSKLQGNALKVESKNSGLEIIDFKPPSSLLKYHVKLEQHHNQLTVNGELQQVLFLTILIVLAILFTYGLAVIVIVGYVYYQKKAATNYLEALLLNVQLKK
jgi:hypothetical protein